MIHSFFHLFSQLSRSTFINWKNYNRCISCNSFNSLCTFLDRLSLGNLELWSVKVVLARLFVICFSAIVSTFSFSSHFTASSIAATIHSFFIRTSNIFAELQCSYFFSSIWASSVLIPILIHLCSINCSLYTWQLLHTWPVEKAGNFPFQKGKKEILKNFHKDKSIVYNKLQIDLKLVCS